MTLAAGRARASAIGQGVGQVVTHGMERRGHPEQDAGEQREAEGEQQHPSVDARPPRAAGSTQAPRAPARSRPTRPSIAPIVPPATASSTLSVRSWRISRVRPAPSAVRSAISRWRDSARGEQQAGHVRARDEQQQRDRAAADEDRGPHVAHDLLLDRRRGAVELAACSRSGYAASMPRMQGRRSPAAAVASVTPSRSRPTTLRKCQPRCAAVGRGIELQRRPQLHAGARVVRWAAESRGHHPDDRRRRVVDHEHAADDRRDRRRSAGARVRR